jgi:hypothetical protein
MEDAQALAPDEARAAIGRLPLDAGMMAALRDPGHAGHAAANAYRRDLYTAAYREPEPADVGKGDMNSSGEPDTADAAHFAAPARPEDYRFDMIPEALKHDPGLEAKARGWFHRAGLPAWFARNVVAEWNRRAANPPGGDAIEGDAVATEAKLRDAWGVAYDDRIAAAREVLAGLDDPELMTLLDRSGLANSEYLIRQLVALAEHRQRKEWP